MNFLMLNSIMAMASEGSTEKALEHTAENTTFLEFLFHSNIINFIFVLIFLVWICRKTQVFSVISKKQNEIKQRIKNAEEQKVKHELELDAAKKKVRKSDDEVAKIEVQANEIAGTLVNKISEETELHLTEVTKRTEKNIKMEKESASEDVMKNVANAAFIVAEQHVKKVIDDRLHKKYIDEFVDNLENIKVK